MLATANGLKESLGEYWTDGLVILWLKPRSGTRRFNQRPPSTSVREIISSNGGFNLRFYIPLFCLLCSCFAVFLLVALCLAVAVPGGGGEQNAFGAFPKLHHGFVWVGQRLDLHAVHGEECGDDEVVQAFWISVFFR